MMEMALEQAKEALLRGEVPVGVVVADPLGTVIAKGYNRCIELSDPCAHGEIIALRQASKELGNYRLKDYIMVCTLEPCLMCYGAILNARLSMLVYALEDPKSGAFSHWGLKKGKGLRTISGVLRDRSLDLLKVFFQDKR